MTCDEAIRAIDAMLDREIEDGERLQLEAHLGGCEACRRETDERRALSDRIGRDLNEAFRIQPGGARRVVAPPRRFAWVRAAAVVLVGVAIGYVGAAGGLFRAQTAEAHDLARLSALKDAYETRDRELSARLEREAGALDRRVAVAPDSAVRDAVSLCVMNAAAGLADKNPLELPAEPAQRARTVAFQLSSSDWSQRGVAVQAVRRLPPGDAAYMEGQVANLHGANRTFAELWLLSRRASTGTAVDCTVETGQGAVRIVQLQNGFVRIEAGDAAAPKVFEGLNLLDIRSRYPAVALQLQLRGVDGNFTVGGVQQVAPDVESRPAMFVPAIVWSAPGATSEGLVEALSVHAVMSDLARAGLSVEETERKALEVRDRVQATSSETPLAVSADPERVRFHLSALRGLDAGRLALTRERLHDDVAALERRLSEMARRLDCVRKATVTLEYAPR